MFPRPFGATPIFGFPGLTGAAHYSGLEIGFFIAHLRRPPGGTPKTVIAMSADLARGPSSAYKTLTGRLSRLPPENASFRRAIYLRLYHLLFRFDPFVLFTFFLLFVRSFFFFLASAPATNFLMGYTITHPLFS